MTVWAIGDLHLSFGIPNKNMDVFGSQWLNHPEKIREHWLEHIHKDDLVLIPGDITWAMHPEQAKIDLVWIDQLPGTKVLIRGNHDYWWTSLSKIEKILPPSLHIIQNNAFHWNNIGICGARLWDADYNFNNYIDYRDNPKQKLTVVDENLPDARKIFQRELQRLEMSAKCFNAKDTIRIAMTHYPPLSADLQDSEASALFEKYRINICVFGHLHNVKKNVTMFGEKNGIKYYLTSCDYMDFKPLRILD